MHQQNQDGRRDSEIDGRRDLEIDGRMVSTVSNQDWRGSGISLVEEQHNDWQWTEIAERRTTQWLTLGRVFR